MALSASPQNFSTKPESAAEYNDLGNELAQQGRTEEAIAAYKKAIELEPDLAIAHSNLGNMLLRHEKFAEAVAAYHLAIELEPQLAIAHTNLGNILLYQGKTEAAIAAYETAIDCDSGYHPAKFGLTMAQLAIVYTSESEIEDRRKQYQTHLENLAAYYRQADPQEQAEAANTVGSHQTFGLAYQGQNDIDLQRTYGSLMHQLMASRYRDWCKPLPLRQIEPKQKIRLGFVSGFFHHHSVWKIPLKGWLENIDRSEFELFGYYTGTIRDRQTTLATQIFDRFTHRPYSLDRWAEKIARDNLDVLIFPEFGMNSMTIKLGSLRLAPVQMTSWGHPNTSGLPTIDYYLSSDLMESENAEEYYSEKLVRLPNLGICHQPLPIRPKPVSKTDLGIKDSEIMFWCCQSLFKYLPQHDDVFPRIARNLDRAKFVFIKAKSEIATEIFQKRLATSFKQSGLDYQNYCIFLPRLRAEDFVGITAIADVFLDNIGWSGCNTTLESISHSIPIVTLPGKFMRGRHTSAILKMLGIEATIAGSKDEYIQIAIRLGQDRDRRRSIARQIAQNKSKLYNDLSPVRALEDFLFEVLNKPRKLAEPLVNEAFQAGIQHQKANNLSAARQHFLQVIAAQPHHVDTLYRLGTIAQQSDRLVEAESYLSAAVKAQPTLQSWFSLANVRQSRGQYQMAEEAYRQALKLRPDSAPICNNLAYSLQQQGDWSAAASYYQKALKIDPKCVAADVNLGNALYAQGKLTAEQQQDYAQLNCKLGLNRQRSQDWQTAIVYYLQAISMQPDLANAHYHLASIRQAQKEFSEAIAGYERALKLNPDCGAYYNLGRIYQDLGNLKQATANFKLGLKLINSNYAKALESLTAETNTFANNFDIPIVPQGEITIGDYKFPKIPTITKPEAKRPFWSIVIPVVNRPEYFPECLASVLAQWTNTDDMEIIVLDNGSEPPQWEIPDELGRGIVRYCRFSDTIPLQENWNTAVSICRGQWIHLLHHDDYVLPGFYARLQAGLKDCPESVGAAFTGYENINEAREVIFSQQYNLGNHRGVVADWILHLGISCPLSPPSVVIRRTAYERLGGYKLDLLYTCDWEFYKRVAAFYDWWYEPGILAHYREQAQSITIAENINGSSGKDHRRAIEISNSYLPPEHRAAITAKSLAFHFDWCLHRALIPLKAGNLDGAICLLKEALKMERSPASIDKLSFWLQQQATHILLDPLSKLEPLSEVAILVDLSRQLLEERQKVLHETG